MTPVDLPPGVDATRGEVLCVSRDVHHRFSKQPTDEIVLVAGVGVEGDAHAGADVQHRSRLRAGGPNLRQVHLIATELLERLRDEGFPVDPGQLGENITTAGVELSGLGVGSIIEIGDDVILAVTGRRNPCRQVDDFAPGLQARLREGVAGTMSAGAMAVVVRGGPVRPGDPISEPTHHHPLTRV